MRKEEFLNRTLDLINYEPHQNGGEFEKTIFELVAYVYQYLTEKKEYTIIRHLNSEELDLDIDDKVKYMQDEIFNTDSSQSDFICWYMDTAQHTLFAEDEELTHYEIVESWVKDPDSFI